MNEHEQLAALCQRLGASAAQAAVMASQLQKRASQLAAERGTTREIELEKLLALVIAGRAGETPKDFTPPPTRPPE